MDILPIWDPTSCVPRREVLDGTLTDADLALRLDTVVRGTARAPYNDPRTFFEATHLTRSMKEILGYIFGRVAGSRTDTNPIIVLDVGFGGGKTHTLVTLYYAAKFGTDAAIRSYLTGIPIPTGIRVVTISGEDFGEAGVIRDDTPVSTVWGDLFQQLGCLERFRDLDLKRQVPSPDQISQALGEGPVIILLDELPTLINLYAKTDPAMMDRIVQFVQRLVIAVAEKERAALVIAIAEDAYKDEAVLARAAVRQAGDLRAEERQQILEETHLAEGKMEDARAHIRRKEIIMSPVEEQDVVHILRRRLFSSTSTEQAVVVADAYHQLYTHIPAPDAFAKQDYRDALQESYPFHPEMVKLLYERLATLDQFHRTRGALRLLARAVRWVWEQKESDAFLLHPHHIDLAVPTILEDLTKGIGEGRRRNALEGDLLRTPGGISVQDLDDDVRAQWQAPLHRRTYTTIYLYSLATGREGDNGIDVTRLCALIAVPGRTDYAHRVRDSVLHSLINDLSHIDQRGTHYLFIREPNPLRVIDREARNVPESEATDLVRQGIDGLFSDQIDWIHIRVFPSNPGKLEDDAVIKLAILNPHLHHFLPESGNIPPAVERFMTYRDAQGQIFRRFKNDTFLLVAEQRRVQALFDTAKKLKAAREVRKELSRFGIPEDRKADVEQYLAEREKDITDGIRTTFSRFVYFNKQGELDVASLNPSGYSQTQGGRAMFLYHLRELFRRIGEDAFNPAAVDEDVWAPGSPYMSTQVLFDAYHVRPGLIIPATQDVFKRTIERGIAERFWILRERGNIYTDKRMPDRIGIANEWEVWKRDEAEKQGLLNPTEETPETERKKKKDEQEPLIKVQDGYSYALLSSPAEAIAKDLEKITKRDRVTRLDRITLRVSNDPSALYALRNLITIFKRDPNCKFNFHAMASKYTAPKYSVSLDLTQESYDASSSKALYEVIVKLLDAEQSEIGLTIEWQNLPVDQLIQKIAEMQKTAPDTQFSLEVEGIRELA